MYVNIKTTHAVHKSTLDIVRVGSGANGLLYAVCGLGALVSTII